MKIWKWKYTQHVEDEKDWQDWKIVNMQNIEARRFVCFSKSFKTMFSYTCSDQQKASCHRSKFNLYKYIIHDAGVWPQAISINISIHRKRYKYKYVYPSDRVYWPCEYISVKTFSNSCESSGSSSESFSMSPPRFVGGTFANILPGEDVCQLWAKIQPKPGKRPFVPKIR